MGLEVGKEAMCVKSHSRGTVKAGEIYTIYQIRHKPLCGCINTCVDVGIVSIAKQKGKNGYCTICNTSFKPDGIHWICAKLFAPIDSISISELTECLLTEPFELK